jgi:hypothetical protein
MTGRLEGEQREKFEAFIARQKVFLDELRLAQEEEKNTTEGEEDVDYENNPNLSKAQKKRKRQAKKRSEELQTQKERVAPRGLGSSRGDLSVKKLVHWIFSRAERKYKADLSIYLAHAEFAKTSKSFRVLCRIYAQALQFHPRNTALWIEAASLEFFGSKPDEVDTEDINLNKKDEEDEENDNEDDDDKNPIDSGYHGGSVHGARVLLQRGIRVNPQAQDLWVQYFALEYHFIQKLRGRQELLKQLQQQGGESAGADEEESPQHQQQEGEGDAFYEGAIPKVVYQNAIKAIEDNVAFRLEFLKTARQFPLTSQIQQQIMGDIERDFGDKPEAWVARASYAIASYSSSHAIQEKTNSGFLVPADDDEGADDDTSIEHGEDQNRVAATPRLSKVMAVLDEALSKVSTTEMASNIVKYLQTLLQSDDSSGVNEDDELNEEESQQVLDYLTTVFERASLKNILSSSLALLWVDLLRETDQPQEAISVLSRFTLGTAKFAEVPQMWLTLAELTYDQYYSEVETQGDDDSEMPKSSKVAARKSRSLLKLALKSVPLDHSKYIRLLAQFFIYQLELEQENSGDETKLADLFQKILLFASQSQSNIQEDENDDDDSSYYQNNSELVCDICIKYVRHEALSITGGENAARNVYNAILTRFGSHLVDHVHTLGPFFALCLELEKSSGGESTGKSSKSKKSSMASNKQKQGEMRKRLSKLYLVIVTLLKLSDYRSNSRLHDQLRQMEQCRIEDVGFA